MTLKKIDRATDWWDNGTRLTVPAGETVELLKIEQVPTDDRSSLKAGIHAHKKWAKLSSQSRSAIGTRSLTRRGLRPTFLHRKLPKRPLRLPSIRNRKSGIGKSYFLLTPGKQDVYGGIRDE